MGKTHSLTNMRILTTSREVREITKAASFKSKPMLVNFGEDYFWLKPKNAEKNNGILLKGTELPPLPPA